MSNVAIPGSTILRETLIAAASRVPQRADWIVMNGQLQPMTFVQELDHYQGSTLGDVAGSATTRLGTLDSHRHHERVLAAAGVGVAALGAVIAAVGTMVPVLSPATAIGIGLAVAGGATADWGRIGSNWAGDEMASTQDFIDQLRDWGAALSQPGSLPATP